MGVERRRHLAVTYTQPIGGGLSLQGSGDAIYTSKYLLGAPGEIVAAEAWPREVALQARYDL